MLSKPPLSNISNNTGKSLANCSLLAGYQSTHSKYFHLGSSYRHRSPEDLKAIYKSRIYLMSNTPHVAPLIQNFTLPCQPTIQSIQ